ncbi:MAG: hypothetical protein AB7N76_32040 [Planctomycetota bacterium]
MSIHYTHAFFVQDLAWRPKKSNAESIHDLLVRWDLVGAREKPQLYEVRQGRYAKAEGKRIAAAGEIPGNLVMAYARKHEPWVVGPQVRRIMGPQQYGNEEGWYWWIIVVLGSDFKISASAYGDEPELSRGAKAASRELRAVTPYPAGKAEHHHLAVNAGYVCGYEAKPPLVRFHETDPATGSPLAPDGPPLYGALWRSGILFDCENDHPAFVEQEGRWEIPNKEFTQALSAAFGTPLIQVGMMF